MKNTGLYINLLAQFNKVFIHNRQGSFKTKERYGEAFKRFIVFLAEEYRLERIANIAPKHIYAYTELLVEKGLSVAYIKTELSAIRFFHDQIPQARSLLPDNSKLQLEQRRFGGVDRTWSNSEYDRFLSKFSEIGRQDYIALFHLARYSALRIHECFRMDTATAEKAIKTGALIIKGKGGLVREVPINEIIRNELIRMVKATPRGQKLFVAPEDKTHLTIHRLENMICYYREQLQDPDSVRPMTVHGLRHTCAAEWYVALVDGGMSPLEARKRVARLLGHGRDSVTRIYLSSVE